MRRSRLAALAVVGASAFVAACIFPDPDFWIVQSEYHVRYMEDADTIQLVELHHGLGAHDVEVAADAVEQLVAGWRRFPPEGGWLFVLDMDEEGFWAWEEEFEGGERPEDVQELIAGLKSVEPLLRVERAGLFIDDEGRLSLFRDVRIEAATRLAGLASDYANLQLRHAENEPGEFQPDAPVFDVRTRELWREAAEADHSWAAIEGGGLVLRVPMTRANAARCMAHLLGEAAAPDGRSVVEFFEHVRTVEVQDELAVLSIHPGEDGWFHFIGDPTKIVGDDSALRDELEERGHSLEDSRAPAELRPWLSE